MPRLFDGFDIANRGQPKVIMSLPKWHIFQNRNNTCLFNFCLDFFVIILLTKFKNILRFKKKVGGGGESRRVVKNQTSILGSKKGQKWLNSGKKTRQNFIYLKKNGGGPRGVW